MSIMRIYLQTGFKMNLTENFLSEVNWLIEPVYNKPLASYTSIRTGGKSAAILAVSSIDELMTFLDLSKRANIPWLILGKGSNVIFTDEGFDGIILQLDGDFSCLITSQPETDLIAGAGLSCFKFARTVRNAGLTGAEFLSTIPGTIGGAVFMNAGAHGYEIKDIITWAEWLDSDGKLQKTNREDLRFDYRYSQFMDTSEIILRAGFKFKMDLIEDITAREKKFHELRKKSQPINMPTWGSVFVNPVGDSAGRLIDSLGLKGRGFGDARISPKHGNFIENTGKATYEDLEKTILLARDAVLKETGIKLETEVRIINPDGSLKHLPEPNI